MTNTEPRPPCAGPNPAEAPRDAGAEIRAELEAALDALIARVEADAAATAERVPGCAADRIDDSRLAALMDGVMDRLPPRAPGMALSRRRLRGDILGGFRPGGLWSDWGRLALPAAAGLALGILAGPWLSATLEGAGNAPVQVAASVASSQETSRMTLFLTSSVPALEL